ncbi:phenylacetic acid degradation bifunctional protein PaaZ [Spectribacter hydrogenoxidans]|uniref:Phenylacetic acid degradation bifunctional protein PaaZ n=1 Tax=Spectribacter hydrogenoxidans TaxID=3075608 RepID=A0ABU3BXB3_9GAMM|nr:phenylacetic acid degradation bifunctional protein PaaZ [Salinisphaera sp. W335]MDT0633962.1 phenylacetic acid degradation bifunctional protein PaaZ [Salinisphaera sp. W335]
MKLHSYAQGQWQSGGGGTTTLLSAVSGKPVADIARGGLDYAGMLAYARDTGGPNLRACTFHQRAIMLKALAKHLSQHKDEFYTLSTETGATRVDSMVDIDGGIGTLFAYSGKGRRELPNGHAVIDGEMEPLSRGGSFIGQHVWVPLEGAAVHINAFNFPCWGMLEKLAANLLAGMPAIIKPASQTAYLTELMFRRMIESELLPAGAVQLICGGVGDLLDHVTGQDVVTFTGSAETGRKLRCHPSIVNNATRFSMEADSLNCSILGPDAVPGTPEFDFYIKEVVREMTVKAGQKCTAIRRVMVPESLVAPVIDALSKRIEDKVVLGHPGDEGVTLGALSSLDQRQEVRERVKDLLGAAELVYGNPDRCDPRGADGDAGAFMSPLILHCASPVAGSPVHDVEAFGPVSTVMPYKSAADAANLARLGQGSLVGSIFTADTDFAREVVMGSASHHGRLLVVDRTCAKESTGHGSPMPTLVHGGPGRAGGGEELGGVRGVFHYMQRTALQGSPDMLSAITGRWMPGASRREGEHPFRKDFDSLRIGDSVKAGPRAITIEDIEHFAEFTGDTFYAHMDEEAAKANPFFDGRVAHGYYIVSLAAGLFVAPEPGPVLANYGVDNLRFMTPAYPGDELSVTLTCKEKNLREGAGYGEVRWDTVVTNQDGEPVAQYDVLTMVATAA